MLLLNLNEFLFRLRFSELNYFLIIVIFHTDLNFRKDMAYVGLKEIGFLGMTFSLSYLSHNMGQFLFIIFALSKFFIFLIVETNSVFTE